MNDTLAARYAAGTVADTDAWSLEKHVEACGRCAARVSAAVRAGTAGPALAFVRQAVLAAATSAAQTAPATSATSAPLKTSAPPTRRFARGAGGRFGRVVWGAGPALRGAWVVAVVLVGAGAVGLAYGAGFDGARPLLLALAPLLPLAGVAVSYGRHADPMYEISASTPTGGLRLLLIRTAAVLGVSVPVLTIAGAALPTATATATAASAASATATATATAHGVPGAAAWLLPGLALTLGALALGSYVGCRTAAGVVGSAWGLAVALPVVTAPGGSGIWLPGDLAVPLAHYFDGPLAQGGWAAAAALCAGVLALRRTSFDRLEFS